MSELSEYISKTAAGKKKTPKEWLENTISLFSKCGMATHVGKFTHPDVRVNLNEKKQVKSSYVMTESTECETDICCTSASYLGAAKLLLHPLEDGKPLWKHIINEDEEVKQDIEELGISFADVKQQVEEMMENNIPPATDGRLRQVYFPVGEGMYHLLTILPASSLLETLNGRNRRMRNYRFECFNDKSECYGNDYDEIPDRTTIGFGGTKPQNISTLNSEAGGKADLLFSMPPILKDKKIRLPRYNFLEETISYRDVVPLFKKLHSLFLSERNNVSVRKQIENTVNELVDVVLRFCDLLREEPTGWSDEEKFTNLSKMQKIWLDEAYRDERDEAWAEETGIYFGDWFIQKYRKIMKEERVPLGEEEMKYIRHALQDVLLEEVRYLP